MLTDDLVEAITNALDEIKIINQNTARIAAALERIVDATDEIAYSQMFDGSPVVVIDQSVVNLDQT